MIGVAVMDTSICAVGIPILDKLGIDLREAALHKLEKNALKYPADQVRGSAKKYCAQQLRDLPS